MILTKFKLFVEARLADVLSIKGESDFASELSRMKDAEFSFEKKLTRFITLKKRLGNKKIQFELSYYDTAKHSLLNRIKNRSSFNSVEEFNEFLKKAINQVFPDKIGKEIFSTGRYSLYSPEFNLSVIISFNIEDFTNGKYQLIIVTILPGERGEKIIEVQ